MKNRLPNVHPGETEEGVELDKRGRIELGRLLWEPPSRQPTGEGGGGVEIWMDLTAID